MDRWVEGVLEDNNTGVDLMWWIIGSVDKGCGYPGCQRLGATELSGEAVRKNSSLLVSEKTSGTQGRMRRMGR